MTRVDDSRLDDNRLDEGRRPGAALVAPAERGATRIADRAVAKIASQAAREALGTVPPAAMPPHAVAVVQQDTARVRVGLELDYPADIGARCAAVRRRVVQRVEALAGMDVAEVAVLVEQLHLAHVPGAAQGRIR
ncbi:hypothetical protein GCM10010344_72690 [Streptomyces bluensis]|nr:hypothetical protein GCM10010344_72690 [Streptomyces bluensis]